MRETDEKGPRPRRLRARPLWRYPVEETPPPPSAGAVVRARTTSPPPPPFPGANRQPSRTWPLCGLRVRARARPSSRSFFRPRALARVPPRVRHRRRTAAVDRRNVSVSNRAAVDSVRRSGRATVGETRARFFYPCSRPSEVARRNR